MPGRTLRFLWAPALLLSLGLPGCEIGRSPAPQPQRPPQYAGQPPPGYGYQQPRPGYQQPPPGYQQPPPGYQQPRPGYQQPQPGYQQPPPGYQQPPPGYQQPPPGYAQTAPRPAPQQPAPVPPAPAPTPPVATAPPQTPAPAASPTPAPPAGVPGIPGVAGLDLTSPHSIARRERAKLILARLVAALPPNQRGRANGIPLVFDDTVGEVNAFAACLNGAAAMALTDGILEVSGNLARAKSYDELIGTNKTGEYIGLIARTRQPQRPLAAPPPGFYPVAQIAVGRRINRELQLFDEQIAFILGHELAHHYLGHLPCTARSDIPIAEINRTLAAAIPAFNQPNELGSDISGVNNLLTAGRSVGWTEGGALLTLDFFSGLQSLSVQDVVFGFERSHPPPQLRRPVVQQTASAWRFTGGSGVAIPGF